MEITELKLGQEVRFTHKLERKWKYGDFGWKTHRKDWEEVESKINKGILVGIRTLKNGTSSFEEEYGYMFTPDQYFTAYMIVSSISKSPFFVKEIYEINR